MCHRMLFTILTFLSLLACNSNNNSVNNKITEKNQFNKNIGSEIVDEAFAALGSQLQQAVANDGFEGAVQYCNIHALPIADTIANKYNVSIKRTSLKVRNEINQPTTDETKILIEWQENLNSKQKIQDSLLSLNAKTTYIKPIFTNGFCLNCHGNKKDIKHYKKIKNLYPTDLAFDYEAGDLRGMWVISKLN